MTRSSSWLILAISSLYIVEYVSSYSSITPSIPKGTTFTPKLQTAFANRRILPAQTTHTTGLSTLSANSLQTGRPRRWHRRMIRKVFRRRSELHTAVVLHEDDFVLRNFATLSPEACLPSSKILVNPAVSPLEHQQKEEGTMIYVPETSPQHLHGNNYVERGTPLSRVTGKKCERILMDRLDKWSHGKNTGLRVQCEPGGSLLQLLRGHFLTDATVTIDSIVFPNIQFSGGKLEILGFALNLLSFAPERLGQQQQRYPRAFQLVGTDFVLTQDDLFASSCIRNGLARLLVRILNNNGLSTDEAEIQDIRILPNGKLSCIGTATPRFGPPISFEVRSGLAFKSRGHILTFPGLELSVHFNGFFVPIPDVSVDLGHNACLTDLKVDAAAGLLRMSMRVTITPDHTLRLKGKYTQATNAYGAHCSVDVGQWLTRLGRFTK